MNIKCHKKRVGGAADEAKPQNQSQTVQKMSQQQQQQKRSWDKLQKAREKTQRAVNLALSESCANCGPGQSQYKPS